MNYQVELCASRIIELTSTLAMQKFAFSVLFLPCWRIFKLIIGTKIAKWIMSTSESKLITSDYHSLNEIGDQHKTPVHPLSFRYGFGKTLFLSMQEVNVGNINLLLISMLEMAIIYGVVAPLVLIIGAIAILVDAATCYAIVKMNLGRITQAQNRPPISYLYVSVACQGSLFVWYCYDTMRDGKEGVLITIICLCGLFVVDRLIRKVGLKKICCVSH
jgi:hypothetical protein